MSSVHSILDTTGWNHCQLQFVLEHDASSVNEFNETGLAPLHRVLYGPNCSSEVVKLLIQHGADVNLVPTDGCAPILTALSLCLDKAIIRELLDGGIDHKDFEERCEYVLCTAFFHGHSADVLRMLVEDGCPLEGCFYHPSIFHCALESQQSTVDAGLLQLLLEKCTDVDMNLLSRYGQSLICLALNRCKGVHIINMLLEAGCSINACRSHSSLWICATTNPSMLTMDVAKLVAAKCPDFNYVNKGGQNPLLMALNNGRYEIEAIKLMLDLQPGDFRNVKSYYRNTVLHSAVDNCYAKAEVVKLLIAKGADVCAVNAYGDTPLHIAVACENFQRSIIRILIDNGADLSIPNRTRLTPLYIGCKNRLNSSILQVLLSSGARATPKNHWDSVSLEFALGEYDSAQCEDNIICCKLFLKYALLDNPNINISDMFLEIWPRSEFLDFANKCVCELNNMKLINISPNCTLFQFIQRCFLRFPFDPLPQPTNYIFDHLLQLLNTNESPLYLDAVAVNVGRKTMIIKLQSVIVYTVISSPDAPTVVKKILNYESVLHLAEFLIDDDDVLRLILAFHSRM